MASIESRKVPGGGTIYRVKVRRKGYPVQSASFRRLTEARKWAQSIEAATLCAGTGVDRQGTGCTVLVTHHSNKGAFLASEQNQSASRGSSALTDGVRWQLNLMTFGGARSQALWHPV